LTTTDWRTAILVAASPDGTLMFAVAGHPGLVPYPSPPEGPPLALLGAVCRARVGADVTGARVITDLDCEGEQ
jgi:hypothetical protein